MSGWSFKSGREIVCPGQGLVRDTLSDSILLIEAKVSAISWSYQNLDFHLNTSTHDNDNDKIRLRRDVN